MRNIDQLISEVAQNRDAIASATALLRGLKQSIIDAGNDEAKLAELVAELDNNTTSLAAAVVENTPSSAV
jgi:hypothetical protein